MLKKATRDKKINSTKINEIKFKKKKKTNKTTYLRFRRKNIIQIIQNY